MRPLAEKQGLSFEIQLPETQEPIFLYGSHQRLLQVLLNLVGNAIKFTHEGGVTIDVDITRKKVVVNDRECPGTARIRVADTGIGVPLDKQDTLFQKFAQVSGGRTRSYGGTGLGLSISQTLVELMGGKINFFSMGENLGSTVTFTIPLFKISSKE
jgi:signal transduction histidine kinase